MLMGVLAILFILSGFILTVVALLFIELYMVKNIYITKYKPLFFVVS